MRRALDAAYRWAAAVACACVLAIAVLMIGQSILREFGVRTGAVNDVVAWLCAAAAFLGMPYAFKQGDFVRVTLLLEKAGPRVARWLELTALTVASVAVLYLAWWATRFTWESWRFNDIANGLLPMPLWIPQSSFVLGAWLLVLAVLDELVRVIRGNRPSYVEAVERRHAEGDFSADL
jgi:TRAP-type C4-dicarboxylate transport system permease small subunit